MRNLLLALALLATSTFAADIDGKWSGSANTQNGPSPVTYTFKADGTTLTGTMTAPDGSEVNIQEGKLEANKLSFKATINVNGMPLSFTFTGEFTPTDLKLVTAYAGTPIEITAKKS